MRLYVFALITIFSLQAFGLSGNLEILESSIWKEGDTRTGRLTIWPLTGVNVKEYKNSLEEKEFLKYFFVSKVKSAKYSKNNPEALVVEFDLTLTSAFKSSPVLRYQIAGRVVYIQYIGPSTIPEKEQLQNVFVFENELDTKNLNSSVLIGASLFILCILMYFAIIFYRKKKIKKEKLEIKNKVLSCFTKVETRKDIEEIYKNRAEWGSYIELKAPSIKEILNTINEIQYKPFVSEAEIDKVKNLIQECEEIKNA